MTKPLPEIELKCRNGHKFPTRARGGMSIDCPRCRQAGAGRVPVRVPAGRPRTDAQATAARDPGDGFADRWAAESAEPAPVVKVEDAECPDCRGPLVWEPARTLVGCPACRVLDLHPDIDERYARDAASQSTAVAVRADPGAERADALALADARGQVMDLCARLADEYAPGDLPAGDARMMCISYSSRARQLAQMVSTAPDLDTLAAIRDDVLRLATEAGERRWLIQDARQAVERAARWQADQAARAPSVYVQSERADAPRQLAAAPDDDDEDYDDDDYDEDEDEDDGRTYYPSRSPVSPLVVTMGQLVQQSAARQAAARAQRERNGTCEFRHRFGTPPAATRVYGAGIIDHYNRQHTVFNQQGPFVRCCSKHQPDALKNIQDQGYAHVLYEDLA